MSNTTQAFCQLMDPSTGVGKGVKVDGSTGGICTVSYEHHEVHGGSSFAVFYAVTTAATDGHRTGIYLKTPAVKEVHMVASFSASTAAKATVLEGPTLDVNEGTHTLAILNRNRNSASTSGVKNNATTPAAGYVTSLTEAQIAAINLTGGTTLHEYPLVAGAGPKPDGGAARDTQEWILKKDTAYLFMITNTAASANDHLLLLDWYEHTSLV
jgi:hypothetical protein